MIRIFGKKVTANQLAKWMVFEKGINAEYWSEDCSLTLSEFTEREIEAVELAIQKQIRRVRKFLRVDDIDIFSEFE